MRHVHAASPRTAVLPEVQEPGSRRANRVHLAMARGESCVQGGPMIVELVNGVSIFHDDGEWYACENVDELPVPLEGPFGTREIALGAAMRIRSERRPPSPAAVAA